MESWIEQGVDAAVAAVAALPRLEVVCAVVPAAVVVVEAVGVRESDAVTVVIRSEYML
jgi:hypothetical protein